MKLTIYTDGASKGNPGDAGIGVVMTAQDGAVLSEISEYVGRTTNNVAEYAALIRGLEAAAALGANEVEIVTDSELMARQLAGVYKVKSARLRPLHERTVELLQSFSSVAISHHPREFNARADHLAKEAVRAHQHAVKQKAGRQPPPSP